MSEKARLDELRTILSDHNHRYYVLDDPSVSDAEYDSLFRQLQAIEAVHPEWVSADSPTQRVGATPSDAFAEVVHAMPMSQMKLRISTDGSGTGST